MMMAAPLSSTLTHLRHQIDRLATVCGERKTLPFGIDAIDAVLPGGGLTLGALHEICEQGSDGARASLSALFVAGILARLPGPVIWCLHSRDLFAPALARVGLHPDRVIYCETWKDAEVLPAMEEGLRQGGLAGVVGELVRLPLMPSRRLQLAAEASGVVAFALRRSGSSLDQANASFSRWRIAASPSGPMEDFSMGAPTGNWICCGVAARNLTPGLWRRAMRRVVSLFLPTWATDRLRRRNGGLPPPELPLITAMQDGNQRVIASVDAAAHQLKLRPGMTIADAQSLIPGLHSRRDAV
jgi:protein ImuA